MLNLTRFRFCPRCAAETLNSNDDKSFICESCGFIYYHGTNASVVAILENKGQLVVTRRGFEPFKDWLAFPGGFVDYGESLETALIREVREELNLEVTQLDYFYSHYDHYFYHDVDYQTNVAYFLAKVADMDGITAGDDVSEVMFKYPRDINPEDFAFEGDQLALKNIFNAADEKVRLRAMRGVDQETFRKCNNNLQVDLSGGEIRPCFSQLNRCKQDSKKTFPVGDL